MINESIDAPVQGQSQPNTANTPTGKSLAGKDLPTTYQDDVSSRVQAPAPTPVETRIQQENAQLTKALSSLGIDPTSEMVAKIASGELTKEQVAKDLGLIQSQPQAPQAATQQYQQPVPQPAQQNATQIQETLKDKIDRLTKSDNITREDFIDTVSNLANEINTIKDTSKQQELTNTYMNCMEAVQSQVPVTENVPQEIKSAMEDMLWAWTNEAAVTEGQNNGDPNAYINPQAYGTLASRGAQEINKLANYYKELGKQEAMNSLNPAPADRIAAVGQGDGGSMAQVPKTPITRDNVKSMAEAYFRQAMAPKL